jgi:CheY-like chemotaxis protein
VLTLIVDDNKPFGQFMVDLLHRHFPAMRLALAGDAGEAWHQVELQLPELIFMDIHLGADNGLDCRRRNPASPRPPTTCM